jgi:hypothetical protein
MGLSPYVRLDVALFGLTGYLLISIHSYLWASVSGEVRLSYVAAGPTELRLMLIALTLAMLALGPGEGAFGQISGFDLFVGGCGSLLAILFLFQMMASGRKLALQEDRSSRAIVDIDPAGRSDDGAR